MKLLDVNVVIAAHRHDHPHHGLVRPWFDQMIEVAEPFAVPDPTWASFVRVTTSRRIFSEPTPLSHAFEFVNAVRAQPAHLVINPGPEAFSTFERLCLEHEAAGDLAADAYLAALAVDQGATLVSLDRDFARFTGLDWRFPGA
jgi:toxin-antitoxin system PIN domain toxin